MKVKKIVVFILIIILLVPITVFGNSSPVYLEKYPSFNIAPREDCPVKVESETLTFKMDENASYEAIVTAKYTLTNTSKENISVPMVFPYVSDGYDRLGAEIIFNGKEIPYEIYSAGHVDSRDYLKEPDDFRKQVDINRIIENLNKPVYEAKNFNPTSDATIYKIILDTPTERQCNVGFHINLNKTKVLTMNFSGFDIDENGNCNVFEYVQNNDVGKAAYILVLGEDTLTNIHCNYSDKIEKSIINTEKFIRENIIEREDSWYNKTHRNKNDFYFHFIREIDRCFQNNQYAFSSDMIIEDMMSKNNISTLLYEIVFEANSTNILTVTYPMKATIDREKTNDYINTFAYILNPAKNFSEVGKIDIQINLNEKYPYVIESSIPLNKIKKGVYAVSLDGLPDEDLVFSSYMKEKITFIDRTTPKILSLGYVSVLVAFVFVVLYLVMKKIK
ncbi:hypothetical protein [Marinisporobacter balticus]|uniref:Uncharacterized protein n=1 Tax=Marinisporobacter balticus TaxID=2018667 RepID=A0A4R2KYR6_9FIRM|nr:hypothetical protein [Marinisporobacter balticus]TCO79811.1 hypothetical protein EV214_10141 [Marinisporobacter balticus]